MCLAECDQQILGNYSPYSARVQPKTDERSRANESILLDTLTTSKGTFGPFNARSRNLKIFLVNMPIELAIGFICKDYFA